MAERANESEKKRDRNSVSVRYAISSNSSAVKNTMRNRCQKQTVHSINCGWYSHHDQDLASDEENENRKMFGKGSRENIICMRRRRKKLAKLKMKQKIAIKYMNNKNSSSIAKTQSVWGEIELLCEKRRQHKLLETSDAATQYKYTHSGVHTYVEPPQK